MLNITKKKYCIMFIVVVITVYVIVRFLTVPITCYCQLAAANTAPSTLTGRMTLFYGLISYMLLIGLPTLTVFFSTLPIRLYIVNKTYSRRAVTYKQLFGKELSLFYIPFVVLYSVSALIFYIISMVIDPIIYVELYITLSNITIIVLLLFSAYTSIYAVWKVVISSKLKALINGLLVSVTASILSLSIMFSLSLFGEFYLHRCDPMNYGITGLNPNTWIIANANSIYASRFVANLVWITVFLLLYYHTLKRYHRK